MIDERNRQRMKQALVEPFGPPRPDLERLALASIERRPGARTPIRALAIAVVVLVLALAVSIALAARVLRPDSGPVGSPDQSAVLEALRQRPLNLPALGPNGSCPQTSQATVDVFFKQGQVSHWMVYGDNGPIYGQGGRQLISDHGYYYAVTWLSDAKYQGLALARGRKLDGSEQIVFAGPLASGKLVTTEKIAGTSTKLYSELVVPRGRAGTGVWRQWPVTQGVPGPGCYGFQVDGPSFEYTVVVLVLEGG